MEAARIGSKGFRDPYGSTQVAYHKGAVEAEPKTEREAVLLAAIQVLPHVSKTLAQEILASDMKVEAFLERHDTAMALWDDSDKIGSLKSRGMR